jgi:transposase
MMEASHRRTQYVRRGVGEKIGPLHCHQRMAYPPRMMLWSCISPQGTGRLYRVIGSMNSGQYCQVISNCLLPQAESWFVQSPWVFQQDNAPCHKSHISINHMQQNGINLLQWPPNSPDLNPIETAWALLKREVHATTETIDTLWDQSCDVWNNSITLKNFCANIPSSMCKRVKEVLKTKGGHTSY